MAVFVNAMKHKHTVHMVGYRADGLKFEQNAVDIEQGQARYVNQDHFGDNDWFIMIAYMKDAKIPDRIGVTQSSEGGGAQIGITIPEVGGFVIGGQGNKTTYYSDGLAAIQSGPHDTWQVVEDTNKKEWAFIKGGKWNKDTLHGW